ncbi:MAG: hypothetical protein LBJ67_06575, partial [Planctomycetaceae bacterium]|nr:hypothetical protein [Planctomycetaceae bacterium]
KNRRFVRPRERRPQKNQKTTFHYQKTLEKHRAIFVGILLVFSIFILNEVFMLRELLKTSLSTNVTVEK